MIVTEKEAAEKWCPHSRYEVGSWAGINRWKQDAPPEEPHALNPVPCRCIGASCMAWRLGNPDSYMWKKPDGTIHYGRNVGMEAEGRHGEQEKGWLPMGYCGLAGRP